MLESPTQTGASLYLLDDQLHQPLAIGPARRDAPRIEPMAPHEGAQSFQIESV
jgi:hypothetical protein